MAISTNGTGGGNWSDGATWNGGVAAGNNDAVIIVAGDTLVIDSDFSGAWADGIAGITITSHATTPGMLTFKTSGAGTYSIKVKTGTTIAGTNAAAKGRLLANSNGTWGGTTALAFDRKAIIDLAGTAYINAQYLDIALYCTQPTTTSVRVYKTLKDVLSINTTTNVITMTAAHGWSNNTPLCVKSSGDMPGGLVAGRVYYAGSVSGADLKLLGYSSGPEIDITSGGTGTIQLYDGHSDTGTGTVNVLDDVTADPAWVTTDGHDHVVLVNSAVPGLAYDQQRLQLTTINETSIVLSANVDSAQFPSARIFLVSRNVSIRSATTTTTTIITWGSASVANTAVLQCEVRATAGSGTTFYGNGGDYGTGVTWSGTICGFSQGLAQNITLGHTISGVMVACSVGLRGSYHTISGIIAGCSYNNAGHGCVLSGEAFGDGTTAIGTGWTVSSTGVMHGCYNPVNNANRILMGGTIHSCYYGCTGTGTMTGTVANCNQGPSNGSWVISGTVTGCTTGASVALGYLMLRGATFSQNSTDISLYGGAVYGWNASLGGTIQVGTYKHSVCEMAEVPWGSLIQDLGGSAGYIGAWCLGGFTKSAAYAVGTHGTPPTSSDIIHETTFEDSDRNTWVEFAVPATSGNPVTVTFYGKLTGTAAWTIRPSIGIYDPTKGWLAAGEELNASAAMESNTDWQTLTATYTPTWDRELRIRMQGKGGNAGGTGTEKLYWFIDVDLGGGGGGAVSISPCRGWS